MDDKDGAFMILYKVRTSCMFSFHDIARFFPLIIVGQGDRDLWLLTLPGSR